MRPHLTHLLIVIATFQSIHTTEEGYLRFVKDGCFLRGEALSCVKYKALKIAKQTIFEDYETSTINATQIISLVPLDDETIKEMSLNEHAQVSSDESKSFLSEWAEVAKYFMKLVQDFFKMKGLRVVLPDGARTVEDEVNDDAARGKKKKLAVIIPLLTLLATMKVKFMLIPVLLAVMLIKKLLLIAALLVPSLLSTLKACKHHHPMTHYSYIGSSDASDYNSDYSNSYSYSSGGGKDWAANRAYSMPKHRQNPAPMYVTAPGSIA